MALLVKMAGRAMVFGLTWRNLPGNLPLQQRLGALFREVNAKNYVLLNGDDVSGSNWGGFLSLADKAELRARGTLYSAGALFAQTDQAKGSAILFGQVAGGYYMVAVRGGIPAAGYELWSRNQDDIQKRAQHFIDATGTDVVALLGRSERFETRTDPISLELLCADSERLERARLKSTEKIAKWKLILVPVVLGLAIGGWKTNAFMKERAAQAVTEIQRLQQTPERQYQNALSAAMAKGVVSARDFHVQLRDTLALPILAGGWQLESMTCTVQQCNLTYHRKTGTYGSFPSLNQVEISHAKGGDLDTVIATRKLEEKAFEQDRSSWPSESDFMTEFGERIQSWSNLGFSWKLDVAQPWALPTGVNASDIPASMLVKSGKWEFSGPLWAMQLLEKLPRMMVFKELNLKLQDTGGRFVAHGSYLVRADRT